MRTHSDMHVTLDGQVDLAGQVYRQIRAALLDGRLVVGDVLPPTRELAARLGVSRNTVLAAYDMLAGEGLVAGRPGAGTVVAATLQPVAVDVPRATKAPGVRPLARWERMQDPMDISARRPEFDFRCGLPDVGSALRLLTRAGGHGLLGTARGQYGDPAGLRELRAAVATHLGVSRAVRATADDVVITGGTQQAADLLVRTLCEPGEVVAMENPGYPMVRALFESHGLDVRSVHVDGEGIVVDDLPAGARLVYVTPSHQFPLGTLMSHRRRVELLRWARRNEAVVIEDDYDTEYRFTGRPLDPLHSLDEDARVVYVGSFSKVLLPALRLGFVVAPPALARALRMARCLSDWHSAAAPQEAVAALMASGAFAHHVRRMRRVYSARRERVLARLAGDLSRWLRVVPSEAGLHVTAFLDPQVDDVAVAKACAGSGVGLFPLAYYRFGEGPPGLTLGYGSISLDRVHPGLDRVAAVLESYVG